MQNIENSTKHLPVLGLIVLQHNSNNCQNTYFTNQETVACDILLNVDEF
jgi:hypothetical protein